MPRAAELQKQKGPKGEDVYRDEMNNIIPVGSDDYSLRLHQQKVYQSIFDLLSRSGSEMWRRRLRSPSQSSNLKEEISSVILTEAHIKFTSTGNSNSITILTKIMT